MNKRAPTILIVGGGPAGSACGTLLAEAGFQVTICEKIAFPRDKICGECINPRTWTYFEILGVADELRCLNLNRIESLRVSNSSGTFVSGQIHANSVTPFFSIRRSLLDQILLNRAQKAGANVHENADVRDMYWQNGWHVMARTLGSLHTIRADILIGADGRNSIVARKMSNFYRKTGDGRNRTSRMSRRVGVQWHTQHQETIGSGIEMFLFDSGYCGVVNLNDVVANVALVTTSDWAQLTARDFPSFLAKTVFTNCSARERLHTLIPVAKILTATPMSPDSHRSSHPCAYLAGDARQTVEPFTGEGILFALHDACSVARTITKMSGKRPLPIPPIYSRFVANNLISPTLQHPLFAQRLIRSYLSPFVSTLAKSFLGLIP